jgi:hypothetical protein
MKPLFVWKTCKSLWNFGETIKNQIYALQSLETL